MPMPPEPDAVPRHHLLPPSPAGVIWAAVTHGESGDRVYRRSDGAAYAKLAPAQSIASLDGERRRSEWLRAQGLPAPEALDWQRSEHGACLLTRALPGVPASELSPAQLRDAWPSLARQLRALHALPVDGCPFERRLAQMAARAADVVARGAVNADFLDPAQQDTPPQALLAAVQAELPARLVQEAGDLVVCHGDSCLPNFLVDPQTAQCSGLVDLGRLGVADRYADLALLVANSRDSWASEAEAAAGTAELFAILGIAPDRERLDFYLRLDPLTWG
ncbi:MAG: APH(3'') family aminoglycoside O-phosphotransferase [Solimonas sp.]